MVSWWSLGAGGRPTQAAERGLQNCRFVLRGHLSRAAESVHCVWIFLCCLVSESTGAVFLRRCEGSVVWLAGLCENRTSGQSPSTNDHESGKDKASPCGCGQSTTAGSPRHRFWGRIVRWAGDCDVRMCSHTFAYISCISPDTPPPTSAPGIVGLQMDARVNGG